MFVGVSVLFCLVNFAGTLCKVFALFWWIFWEFGKYILKSLYLGVCFFCPRAAQAIQKAPLKGI